MNMPPMFAQPFGPSPSYGPPPYSYEGATTISTLVRFDPAHIARHLPPGVTQGVDRLGVLAASDYQSTSFGAYREFSVFVHATFEGREFMYSPIMLADSDAAVAAGRELWGFAKKAANITVRDDPSMREFAVNRHDGVEIAHVQFEPTQQKYPEEISEVDFPTLTLRLIPPLTGDGTPDIAQLVATVNRKTPLVDEDGAARRWVGSARIDFPSEPESPLADFRPLETLAAWVTQYSCLLPAGELVHDYLGRASLSEP